MKLRPYQTRAVEVLPRLLADHGRVLAVAPTGSGKTVIGAALVRNTAGHVLWLVHRVELVAQAYAQLQAAGISASELGRRDGQVRDNEAARVLVASIQSYDPGMHGAWDLIVVDEAHHALAVSYAKALDRAKAVLGLTASPWRLDGTPLGDCFRYLHEVATNTELIASGYIAAPICYGLPHEKVKALLAGVRSNGDYNEKELSAAMRSRGLIGDLVQHWERLGNGRSTVVYAVNREHGRKIFARFKARHHKVAYLDGQTPAPERAAILAGLASGSVHVVVSINVISEGFDCAPVKCVVLARPTKSLSMYLQQVGRGSRPHKQQAPIVLDHAGNVNRHGFPQIDREWSLTARPKRLAGDATRHCPECNRECPIGARECECGYRFPRTELELAEQAGELEQLREREAFKMRLEKLAEAKIPDPAARKRWVISVMAGVT